MLGAADDGFGGGAGAGLGEIDWGQHQLVPFEKNFYMEHPDVTAMTPQEVRIHQRGRCVSGARAAPPHSPVRT